MRLISHDKLLSFETLQTAFRMIRLIIPIKDFDPFESKGV